MLTNKLRVLVSKKKNRFQEDGYDLDLTYISDRIVAMGYPASGSEKIYRNDRDVVKQFLEQYHKNNYQIYNLCIERGYEESFFDMRVQRFPFEDHMPPPFSILLPCCQSLDTFLAKDPKNIAAIHCKAGKGRTGVIIAAYMVYLKLYKKRRMKL
jgi:phosphatidylinositol-3,4,5-trisphosphate 3-phosphatase/dual-specificity protein phosphatase PTEN